MDLIILSIDKSSSLSISEGAMYSLVSIIMVFVILLIIIGITSLIFKLTGLFDLKKELDESKKRKDEELNKEVKIKDDDMMAAVITATIDYRNEVKKDVRVVNIKEIK